MKNPIYNFLRTLVSIVLTQEAGNTVSTSMFKFKNKHKRFFRLFYGTATDEEILNNITQKLDGKIDILMVHSSFNGMIPMYKGSLMNLLSKIMEYCREHNITLAMPAFFNGSNHNAKEYYEDGKKFFDVRNTFSEVGLLSELFRNSKGVKRSIHPTHSVCASGPLADELTKNHHLSITTCGDGTPFGEMIKYRSIILGIGVRTDALTQVHSAEDLTSYKFPLPLFIDTLPIKCLDDSGNTLIYNLRIKNPDYYIDTKSFRRIIKGIEIIQWMYKGIPFFFTEAKSVTDTFIEAAKNGKTIYKSL